MKLLYRLTTLALATFAVALPNPQYNPVSSSYLSWSLTATNSTAQLRGLSPVSNRIAWVSGTSGTILRTTNGGASWINLSPPFAGENASDFQFRDIQAWSEKSAVTLSIGEGNASRIYVTKDGGKNWKKTFVNEEAAAFYDCLAFENEKHGLALSDPVDGKFRLIETWNGGTSWKTVDPEGIPAALTGEFGFAASGTCIEAAAGRWYIASGGVDPGRIYRSNDGHHWEVSNQSSIAGGAAAGVFSVRFRDEKHGVAVGGDYEKPTGNANNAAWSKDGGKSWVKAGSFPGGYRSGVSWVPGRRDVAVAVGTSGSDITLDAGKNWHGIGNGTFDAVECVSRHVCWASGAKGRVARLELSTE
ncbi:Oligoxyloglucan reducing end-specific cellobiohydrolase [Massarina eburnea CBS 473.64]|uniref:Oligoxyloglucan reducing end-specific cellobiohydrolase n=1 Tax=Massarina eburnea CBS 473.64 TaxID=1395130 RepID=A0A6A6S5G0_9PLEO|nr:Oligoxyloglucan reducing end-specific cellobiohydrolase [Massarina eburnea CBS 473.64]